MNCLNESERRFCESVVAGKSGTDAYQAAYPRASRNSAQAKACLLLRRERIIAEIVRLRAEAQTEQGSTLMTLIEKRQYLARVVRSRPALLVYESDLWQTISETRYCAIYRVPDKITAIILDNKLAGHGGDNAMQDELSQLLVSIRR